MIELEENKHKLISLKERLKSIGEALRITELKKEIKELEAKTNDQGFWDNNQESSNILTKMKRVLNKVENFEKLQNELENLESLNELLLQEEDIELGKEVLKNTSKLEESLEKLEMETLLSGKYDKNNAILTLHPGAGGTESQDWAEMLYRMYCKWAVNNGFEVQELDYLDGDEAGIKSVTFLVKGENAYGYLKGEMGVHRLVRISPFDSGGRRHTSFASLEVLPEITEDIKLDINPEDIKMDVYRASGAGGQKVNKTSSAVRLIHEPTGIVAECQTERSQTQNREYAMNLLKSRLYEIEKQKQDEELHNERKSQVGTGDRSEKIRTYNYPQGRITDHRIGLSIYQMESFLNGNLDEMIDNLIAADRAEKLKGNEEK